MISFQSNDSPTEALRSAPKAFVRMTNHAVDRYRERVDCGISRTEAAGRIQRILADGVERDRPRAWMEQVNHLPGTAYVYCPLDPETCLVVRGGAVLTVLTRELGDHRPARRQTVSGRQARVARRRRRELAWLEDAAEQMLDASDHAEAFLTQPLGGLAA